MMMIILMMLLLKMRMMIEIAFPALMMMKVMRKGIKWDEFNPKTDMAQPTFKLRILFSSAKVCAQVVK